MLAINTVRDSALISHSTYSLCSYLSPLVYACLHPAVLTLTELEDAINDFIKLVPNEFHRKFYLRIYKWTIAFASWKKPHEELEGIIRTLYPNQQRQQQQEGGDSSLAVFNNPLFRGTNTSSPGRGKSKTV
jgi:hypothetical protein